MVCKYYFPIKGITLLRELVDSRAGAGNHGRENSWWVKHPSGLGSKEVLKKGVGRGWEYLKGTQEPTCKSTCRPKLEKFEQKNK